jgi:ADP-ribose pyrophosphatase YjhB (NUDIX family)
MVCDERSLIADIALFANGKVLLVRYSESNKYDHQRGWFLPDAGIGPFEHPERAARRILHEQLGYSVPTVRLVTSSRSRGTTERGTCRSTTTRNSTRSRSSSRPLTWPRPSGSTSENSRRRQKWHTTAGL